jgi:hypothetical protein
VSFCDLSDTSYLFFYDANQGMGGYTLEEKHLFRVVYYDGDEQNLGFPDFPKSMETLSTRRQLKANSPAMLDFPPGEMLCYNRESAIAEKLQPVVYLGDGKAG